MPAASAHRQDLPISACVSRYWCQGLSGGSAGRARELPWSGGAIPGRDLAVPRGRRGLSSERERPRRDGHRRRLAGWAVCRRLAPFQLLARNGDLEGADSGKAEPHARAVFDDGHQGVVAMRTAHDDSSTSKDLECPNLVSRAASVARLDSGRHLDREHVLEKAGGRVAVHHQSIHLSTSRRSEALGSDAVRLVPELHEYLGGGLDEWRRAADIHGWDLGGARADLGEHLGVHTARIAGPARRLRPLMRNSPGVEARFPHIWRSDRPLRPPVDFITVSVPSAMTSLLNLMGL